MDEKCQPPKTSDGTESLTGEEEGVPKELQEEKDDELGQKVEPDSSNNPDNDVGTGDPDVIIPKEACEAPGDGERIRFLYMRIFIVW